MEFFISHTCLRQLSSSEADPEYVAKPHSPARYAANRMAKVPSKAATAVIANVRLTGPKQINKTMASFSTAAAVKIGTRVAGKYALYTVRAHTTKSSAPQCLMKNIVRPSVLSAPNTNRKTSRGKRHATMPPKAVAVPETMSIHPIDDASTDPPCYAALFASPTQTRGLGHQGWFSRLLLENRILIASVTCQYVCTLPIRGGFTGVATP